MGNPNKISKWSGFPGAPFENAYLVTPADSDLALPVKSIWVGGVGNLTIITPSGDTVTFTAVAAGTLIPVQADQIKTTLTTATLIIGLY